MHDITDPFLFSELWLLGYLWDSALTFAGLCFCCILCEIPFTTSSVCVPLSRGYGSRCQPWGLRKAKRPLLTLSGYGILSVLPHVSHPALYYCYFHKCPLRLAEL